MNFNLYNLLSNLIPGVILYLVGAYVLNMNVQNISEVGVLAVAYMLGYFINAVGGWFEKIFFWSWGGEPGIQLLRGQKCGRIKLYELDKINCLKEDENMTEKKTFQKAMRLSNENKRVSEMNASYAFSRTVLALLLMVYIILTPTYLKNVLFHFISLAMIFLAWYRSKERAFYYSKEVIICAINKCQK